MFFHSSKIYILLYWWAHVVFNLYLQKSEFYFHYVNWTTARGCEKAAKKDIRILYYQSTEHLSDCNWAWTHNQLVCKRTLSHLAKLASLAKWVSVRLRTKLLWVRVQSSHLNFRFRACFEQGVPWQLYSVDSLWSAYVTRQEIQTEHLAKSWW